MIAVAIPDMAKGLGESPLRLNLVITTYLLSLAVFIPVSGWIADRLGTRVVFCVAIAIFAAGSALCGLSTSLPMMLAMRVLQGFGGAMMTPVGRLILLRSFPRSGLVSAMNWMTIPAMIGPTVGPIVGGFLTTYLSWRAIFYLNLPIGIAGVVLALWLIEDFRAPAPTRFDLRGFFIAGLGLALLELAIENVGRPMIPGAARGGFLRRCLRHSAALSLACPAPRRSDPRPQSAAHPHLPHRHGYRQRLPDGSRRGAVPVAADVPGRVRHQPAAIRSLDLFVEPRRDARANCSRGLFCASSGFAGCSPAPPVIAAAVTAGCGLLRPDTPAWLIVLFVLLSGCVRSIQYLGLNTISYADVPAAVLSKSTSVGGVAQQLARGFGIAIGAALLALIAGPRMVTVGDFRLAFFLIALLPLLSALGFLRLSPEDGAEVSGHHRDAASLGVRSIRAVRVLACPHELTGAIALPILRRFPARRMGRRARPGEARRGR